MSKKILYLDLDGVIADFDKAINSLSSDSGADQTWSVKVNTVCKENPEIFHDLPLIDGAIEATTRLFELFDVYFLSSPMWDMPTSFVGKRHWIEKHFGEAARRRLILTYRKDLNIGDYLVDDRLKNGAAEFRGMHIHFGTKQFPNWEVTLKYLESVA